MRLGLGLGQGIHAVSLGVSYQIGAVLLTACVGGKNAGALAQIAYVVLGLNLPVFTNGGGTGLFERTNLWLLTGLYCWGLGLRFSSLSDASKGRIFSL
jgi:hypothetical protein